MSWFPVADLGSDSSTCSNDGFLGASPCPSLRASQDHYQVDMESGPNRYSNSDTHDSSWDAQGLGLFPLPITTESTYEAMATATGPYVQQNTVPLSWSSEFIPSIPSTARPELFRKDSWSSQSCDPLSTLLPGALCDHLRPRSLSVAGYNTSPGRSEYSLSSHPSSPYAHSDSCVRSVDSPQIKTEYPLDHSIPHINFVPDEAHHEDQSLPTSHGDPVNQNQRSIEDRVRQYLGSSSNSDNGDYKPAVQRDIHRRPHSFGDFGALALDDRPKRTLTKPENASYSCDLCGKPFQRAYNLKSHIANVHNRHRAKQHLCEHEGCTHSFVRRTDLTRHVDSVHKKSRDYKCDLCSKDFPRKDTLMRHVVDGCPRRDKVRRRAKSKSSLHKVDRLRNQPLLGDLHSASCDRDHIEFET